MSYDYKSIVNKTEAVALKEMIFKRVQERSQSMTEDVQADVMDMARDSFVSNNNPFSEILNNKNIETKNTETRNTEKTSTVSDKEQKDSGIGFSPRVPKIKQAKINNDITASVINNNMMEARNALTNNSNFVGALNFLNSQAAVSLIKTRETHFDVIA